MTNALRDHALCPPAAFFRDLGDTIARLWCTHHHDERAFPELAARALRDRPPAAQVQLRDVIDALLFTRHLPPQPAKLTFGQPPIVVYSHPRFYIEVLCWMDATTTIHQHAFSGAFHVMQGSSLHSRFDFEVSERINGSFLLGALRLTHAELLRVGDTRAILAGPALIHGLFHLEAPSVSVVVRTRSEPDVQPQYDYLPPGIAVDPLAQSQQGHQQALQVLSMLLASDRAAFNDVMGRLLVEADLPTVFELLRFAHVRCVAAPFDLDQAALFPWVARARARFGSDRVEHLLDTIVASTRVADIQLRRADVVDDDHRFLLALLMNLPNRSAIFALVRERHNADPEALVLRWLKELTREVDGEVCLLDVVARAGDGDGEAALLGALLERVLAEMVAGAEGPELLRCVSRAMADGVIDGVADAVPLLEQQLRESALHALFVGGAP